MTERSIPGSLLPNFSIDLTGQVAIVTGASSGLGVRFAEVLSACGAAVALTGRRIDRLKKLESEIKSRGGQALAVQLDNRDPGAIQVCVEKIEDVLGVVSILINNAAVLNNQPAIEITLDTIDDQVETNFRAPFLMSTEIARRLIKHKRAGRIVNISSVGAYHNSVNATTALYSATKSAVLRLTESLAVEWAKYGINVNAIAPGLFLTEMSEPYMKEAGEQAVAGFPRKRAGKPEQLDSTLLYLVSPSSEFVTGICLLVDDVQLSR